jgi:hypothetical protein
VNLLIKQGLGLISEEEWKPYCKVILADEEKTVQSETVYENEYVAINMVGLRDASRRSENRKAPGLDALLWNC